MYYRKGNCDGDYDTDSNPGDGHTGCAKAVRGKAARIYKIQFMDARGFEAGDSV